MQRATIQVVASRIWLVVVALCSAAQLLPQPVPELQIRKLPPVVTPLLRVTRNAPDDRWPSPPEIRVNVDLVQVSALVTDRRGATVNGLAPGQFAIFEDDIPQEIRSFSIQESTCSMGVILDLSGSMRVQLPEAVAAVRSFLGAANPEDESFLLTVASRPAALSGFTADFAGLQNRLWSATADGSTALIDTIYMGLDRIRGARHGRRALLIVSDGMDNNSRYVKGDLLRAVQESDVQVYTVAIAGAPATDKAMELRDEANGLSLLSDLADRSGGLNFTVTNGDAIGPAVAKISRAIRDQYVLGYLAAGGNDSGKWRRIRVTVDVPNLRVYSRRGYYSQ